MKRSALLSAAMVLMSCSASATGQENSIVDYNPEVHGEQFGSSRFVIEIYSGRGIPGSPGADIYITDYRNVLQGIVVECTLGETVLVQATDGVSILTIVDDNLTEEQMDCVRAAERPGLTLRDRGSATIDGMENADGVETVTRAEIDALSDSCDAPREWLALDGSQLTFEPEIDHESDNLAYEKAACVLNGIRQIGNVNFGFVGNERYVTPDKGQ